MKLAIRLARQARFVRRLTIRMVLGRLRQEAIRRYVAPVSWHRRSREVRTRDLRGLAALRAFADAYSPQGTRFESVVPLLHRGTFVSGGITKEFGSPDKVQWGKEIAENPAAYRWEHDLAYFNFALPLIDCDPERGLSTVAILLRAMETQADADPGDLRKFHWSPIAMAYRCMSLTAALARVPHGHIGSYPDRWILARHVRFCGGMLRLQAERYLGFNHAVFTEMGLMVAHALQGRERSARRSAVRVLRTLSRCITTDGVWAERSPTYHIHMLSMAQCLKTSGSLPARFEAEAVRVENVMREAMDAIVHVDGEVAVFNDAAIGDAVTPSSVGWVPSAAPRDLVLTDAGYAHIIRDRLSVIFDAGPMGPREVLGHGHADFLSIQVCIAGARVVVDPGVAAIAAGRDRDWTRSAESHNGPTYGGVEPAEFFGAWRVGWSGTASLSALVRHSEREVELAGTADGYSRFGGGVSRRLIVSDDAVLLRDTWVPIRGRQMVSRFIVDEAWRIDSTESALGLRHHSGARAQFSLTTGTLGSIRAVHHFPRGPSEPCLGREIEFLAPDGLLELEIRAL